jgi:hypothetical protein
VHAYDGIPVVGSHLDQHVVAGDTGVVRQRVGSTKLLGHPGHGGLHRVFVGHVDADGQRLTPGCLDLLDDRLAGGLLEVQDGDGEAVVAQPLGDGCSDTRWLLRYHGRTRSRWRYESGRSRLLLAL